MRRRVLLVILGVGILTVIALWLCLPAGAGNSDAARYQRWKHIPALYKRAVWWKAKLPRGLARAVHLSALPGQYLDERERLTAALVASGYLTNVSLTPDPTLTNSTRVRTTVDRIRKAHQAAEEWTVALHSNTVVIICRPQDEFRCRQALQQ